MEKERMIIDNMPLAVFIAQRYSDTGMELDDLIGTAYMGLCRSVKYFKEEKGYCFSTFAKKVICNEIHMALRKFNKTRKEISLYEKIGDDFTIMDTISDPSDGYYLINCSEAEKMTAEQLITSCKSLSDKERIVLIETCLYKKKQREVAAALGVTQAYVSRLYLQAKDKLKRWHLKRSA